MPEIVIPASFTLAQYRLTLAAVEPLPVSLFKGSALRGGFGHTFKRLACRQPWPCDKYCQMGNRCAYGYIFETAPPEDTTVLRNFEDVPRPFIIKPPRDPRSRLAVGEALAFELVLVGRADQYRQNFEEVFRELGRVGLGKASGKYRLMKMELTGQTNRAQIMAHAAALPTGRLTLNFLTPTRLKHQGEWVWEGPPFEVLVKALLGRISSLSYFHCGQAFEADFRGLIDRAATVKIVKSDALWQDWSRFSGRQQQRIEMGGLVGQVTYEGDLGDYLPLLALGELVHGGKGAVFGNGQYQIVR
ncbi:MAG: CRISPR system precrRNA processing endoribonuclease RAMP protein Cas6 [Chloroflexota bacterium]